MPVVRRRHDGRPSGRIKLQLDVPGRTSQRCPLSSDALQRLDAWHVGRHQVRQIEHQATVMRAGREQFRNLRDTQPASQTDHASIDFRHDANPTIHKVLLVPVGLRRRHDEPRVTPGFLSGQPNVPSMGKSHARGRDGCYADLSMQTGISFADWRHRLPQFETG